MAAESMKTSERIIQGLAGYRFNFSDEADLQMGISAFLTKLDIRHDREVRLFPPEMREDHPSYDMVRGIGLIRLDFLCDEGLAIEVKVATNKNRSALIRQLHRYAVEDRISELLVISNGVFSDLPDTLNGKPIGYYFLSRSAF